MRGWRGGFFFKLNLVWRVDCPVSIWTVDFPCKFYGGICFPFSQWEGPRCLASILLSLRGRKGHFFHFSLFPNVFPRCFLEVPMGSQYVLHLSTSLLFHTLWQILFSFHLYGGLKRGTIYIKTEPSILSSLHTFIFWGAMGQSNWLVAPPPPKRKKELGRYFVSLLTLLLITWPQWTSTHHRTIHWMPIITQCGWTSTGLIFGFTLVTSSVLSWSHIEVDR